MKCSNLAEMPSLLGNVSALPTKEVTAFPLGGVIESKNIESSRPMLEYGISKLLNWGKCRRRETLLSTEIKNGKEGLFQI